MAQFVNTILISIVAFFAFLAVFGFFNGFGGAPSSAAVAPSITRVSPHWTTSSGESALAIDLAVHNPATADAHLAQVTYTVQADGVTLGDGSAPVDTLVPAGADGQITVLVPVPSTFAASWWDAYAAAGETAGLHITGTVRATQDQGTHDLPFEWTSGWQGHLTTALERQAPVCPSRPQGVCLQDLNVAWNNGGLAVTMRVRNGAEADAVLENGSIQLVLDGHTIGEANVDRFTVTGGATNAIAVQLPAIPDELGAWFAAHLQRCESSPIDLVIQLSLEGTPIRWDAATTLTTHLVCGAAA